MTNTTIKTILLSSLALIIVACQGSDDDCVEIGCGDVTEFDSGFEADGFVGSDSSDGDDRMYFDASSDVAQDTASTDIQTDALI
jgi:hypothetical protein